MGPFKNDIHISQHFLLKNFTPQKRMMWLSRVKEKPLFVYNNNKKNDWGL